MSKELVKVFFCQDRKFDDRCILVLRRVLHKEMYY